MIEKFRNGINNVKIRKENLNQKVTIDDRNSKEIKEVKTTKKKISKRNILLLVAIFAFALSSVFSIISIFSQVSERRAELLALEEQLEIIEIENDYLEEVKNLTGKELDDYIENIAREELDYVKNGERVFVNVSGN